MRFIRTYILKFKLAAIFKQAEQLSENGVATGDQRYKDLLNHALFLTDVHRRHYPDFRIRDEVPGMTDLEQLCIEEQPTDPRKYIIPAALGVFALIQGLGLLAASINVSYHGWLHLFHYLHLGV